MIELRWRRQRGIELSQRRNQHRVGANACGFEHCGEEGVFVFAVAILICKNFRRWVRLVTRETEREADVPNIFGNVIVERLDLVEFRGPSLNQLLRFWAN